MNLLRGRKEEVERETYGQPVAEKTAGLDSCIHPQLEAFSPAEGGRGDPDGRDKYRETLRKEARKKDTVWSSRKAAHEQVQAVALMLVIGTGMRSLVCTYRILLSGKNIRTKKAEVWSISLGGEDGDPL
ncbi:hypothetical protein EYF80_029649 [Liparis tanakae]|uniref:Uncharacterized protein n=1 Tax=Liparis tanakae TaxID=230148 RepID=A0A4Z2H2I1_9TELE|nr:hypothetical protein EYF80_029649 [Liparis tanakae]